MHTSLLIRNAIESDINRIRFIAHETWPVAYAGILSKEQLDYMLEWMYSEKSLTEQMLNKGHQFFMAESDGKALGFASVSNEGNAVYKLNKLYVLPQTQKTGAGKSLLNKVIEYAGSSGGKKLQLQVNRNNAAKGFYEKNGFIILREADLEIGNGFLMQDYIMELDLQPSPAF